MYVFGKRTLLPGVAELQPGFVEIDGAQVVRSGAGRPTDGPFETVDTLVPGYVDVHCHGGGGVAFATDNAADVDTVLATHRVKGTTTMMASLVTAPLDVLEQQVRLLAPMALSHRIAGIHIEGPWLAVEHRGAHPENLLRDPNTPDVVKILDAGQGTVRMVTLAPERTNALAATRLIVERGCVVAVGHTDGDYDAAHAGVEAGATGATHLFNGMPELLHRDPGPALALWRDPRVWLELIADGIHTNLDLIAHVMASAPGRAVLITDAIAAAGAGDGDYIVGAIPIEVREGVARMKGGGRLAGSTLTLDRAVRIAVSAGVDQADALRAATENPADYLGLDQVGRLAPGCRADLLDLDDELNVRRVMWGGQWI